MSLGARLYLLFQDLNQKRCERCSLHYKNNHDKCPHCSDMTDAALDVFLEERGIDPNAKSGLRHFIVFAAIIVLVIFFLSKLIKT
jgi:hypothetical protein